MAIKTGSIEVRPTKYGAKSSSVSGVDAFLSQTGDLTNTTGTTYYVMLYGLNFNSLQGLDNVKITNVAISVSAKDSTYTGAGSVALRFVTDFSISGTTTSGYTDVGGGYDNANNTWSTSERDKYYVHNYAIKYYPDLITWMNSNIAKVINGYTTNSFGLCVGVRRIYVNDIKLTVSYTYETPTYTVTTSVSPAGAGTVTPTQQVESGATATVTATPATGYKFSHWLIDGADSGVTTPTITGTITSNIVCTAVFVFDKINKIFCDTSQPKKILIDAQEVKAVYIDKTKVYG